MLLIFFSYGFLGIIVFFFIDSTFIKGFFKVQHLLPISLGVGVLHRLAATASGD